MRAKTLFRSFLLLALAPACLAASSLEKGLKLMEKGDYEKAVPLLQKSLQEQPGSAQALRNLGWAHLDQGRVEEAYHIWRLLTQLDPENAVFLRFLAETQLLRGNNQEAERLARKVLQLNRWDRGAGIILAQALAGMQREPEALEILHDLVLTKPDDPKVAENLAVLLSRLGRGGESLPWWDLLIRREPGNPAHRRRRAETLYELGRLEEALDEWRRLAQADPPDERSILLLVEDAYQREDWDESDRWLKRLEAVRPLRPSEWTRKARTLAGQGRMGSALEAAEKAVAADPASLEGLQAKAELLEAAERWAAAYQVYEEILRRQPQSRRALSSLYRVSAALGEDAKALKIIKRLQRPYPSRLAAPHLAIQEAWHLSRLGRPQEALAILREVAAERSPVVPVLLYSDLSLASRGGAVTLKAFQKQVKALKEEGYQAVTVEDLAGFFQGKAKPPRKPVMITLDDARTDVLEKADEALRSAGMKAVLFAHLTGSESFPFQPRPDDLRRLRATGRWEIQSHGTYSHGFVPIDREGRRGLFLTNRRWLEEGRLETLAAYRARIAAEYLESREALKAFSPGAKALAFAFPSGDYGQLGDTNVPKAYLVNQALVRRHFRFAFVQDPHGFNTRHTPPLEFARLAVDKDMTPEGLVRHLRIQQPWVRALLLEAKLRRIWGQPAAALAIYEELDAAEVRDSEILAEKSVTLSQMGQTRLADELETQARALASLEGRALPASRPRGMDGSPSVGGSVEAFADDQERSFSKTALHTGVPVSWGRVSAWLGRSRYVEPGRSDILGREGGLRLRTASSSRWGLSAFYSRLLFPGTGVEAYNGYGGELSVALRPLLRLAVTHESGPVPTGMALTAGRSFRHNGFRLDWDPAIHTTLAASFGLSSYSDSNDSSDLRLGISRRLRNWIAAGYSFWYGDSAFRAPEYWTPRSLKQHMATVSMGNPTGAVRARLELGAGVGFEEAVRRGVHYAAGVLEWRLSDLLLLRLDGAIRSSPTYESRSFSGGLHFGF